MSRMSHAGCARLFVRITPVSFYSLPICRAQRIRDQRSTLRLYRPRTRRPALCKQDPRESANLSSRNGAAQGW